MKLEEQKNDISKIYKEKKQKMGLFNKKMSLEDILKAIESLSEEEKAEIKAKMEEPSEQPKVEETPSEEPKGEEVIDETPAEPTEEIGEVEESAETGEPSAEPVEEPSAEQSPVIESETNELNPVEQENKDDVMQGVIDRLQALEEKLAEFDELKALMEDFTKKQADSFGYKGAIPGAKKDIHEMSASELKEKMLNGEI